MTARDFLTISIGNLWRMKLRTFLTTAGVVIAIGAFVSMLSFGAGNQKYITDQYNELGLLSTIQVYPQRDDEVADTIEVVPLNDSAIVTLSAIPGVNLAYPFNEFSVTVSIADTSVMTDAQALSESAFETRLFSQMIAGSTFLNDSAKEALVTEELLEMIGFENPDSVLGRTLVLSVQVPVIDSGLARVLQNVSTNVRERLADVRFDSLMNTAYRQRLVRNELSAVASSFADGYMNAQATVSDTLIIRGVLKERTGRRLYMEPIVIPMATARRFSSSGYRAGGPMALLTDLSSGAFLAPSDKLDSKNYPQVTLDLDPQTNYKFVQDSIEALGFRTFSFAEQFKKIREFFLYFNLILGVIGFIALTTASLGIVNTMVMSIVERTREIGILKSLGADVHHIRWLFLVESGVIGGAGAILGILLGWTITRVASAIAKTIMERQGVDGIELFAMPVWLILTAFLFGLVVSLLAGSYPASRAARVDAIVTLRNE